MYTSLGTCKCVFSNLYVKYGALLKKHVFSFFFLNLFCLVFVLFYLCFCVFPMFVSACACFLCWFFLVCFCVFFLFVFYCSIYLLLYLLITIFIVMAVRLFLCVSSSFLRLLHHHHLIHLLDCPNVFDATLYKGFVDVYYVYPI